MMQEQIPQHPLPDHALTLDRAAAMVGGRAQLARRLKILQRRLDYWIGEIGRPPDTVFFDAIDIIIENAGASRGSKVLR